jgi:hypothetical protein
MTVKDNEKLLTENELVQSIHDQLLDNHTTIQNAFEDACVWIAELHLELESLRGATSSGYLRGGKNGG